MLRVLRLSSKSWQVQFLGLRTQSQSWPLVFHTVKESCPSMVATMISLVEELKLCVLLSKSSSSLTTEQSMGGTGMTVLYPSR